MSHLDKVFGLWDYIVFISLLLSSSLIGIYFAWQARNAKNSDHFFTGGRRLAIFPVTMSLVASFMSTNTLLGVPAEVFQVGTQYIIQTVSIVIVIILAAEVYMPVFYRMQITSINEYLEKRFNSKAVKLVGSIGFLLSTVPYMAVVLYGPAIALASVIRISISTSIIVVGVICTFYTSIGGIKAVIWTDVLQGILMFLGVAIVIIQGLIELGGFGNIFRIVEEGGRLKIFNAKFDLYNHDNAWNVLTGSLVGWGAAYCASQTQVQRYLSMRSPKEAKKTLYLNLPGLIILAFMSCFCGMILYAKYHSCDPVLLGIVDRHDQLMPYYVMETLSQYPGIAGLFVACVFSGSLSTLSSGFNALAAITWEDLVKSHVTVDGQASIKAVKIIAMAYGLLAIGLSFGVGSLGTVLQASMSLHGALNGPIFYLFTSGICCRFMNAKGAISGFTAGLAVAMCISLGSIAIPRPKISLPTAFDACSADIFAEYLANGKMSALPPSKFLPYYDNPVGLGKLFHISYLITSTVGFVIATIVGVTVSLATGGLEQNTKLDDRLLSPLSRYLPPFQKVVFSENDGPDAGLEINNNKTGAEPTIGAIELVGMTTQSGRAKSIVRLGEQEAVMKGVKL